MNRLVLVVITMLLASAAAGSGTIAEISWSKEKAKGALQAGQIVSRNGVEMLKIENKADKPLRVSILTLDHPSIPSMEYAISGSATLKNEWDRGQLEMLSYIGAGKPFFSTCELRGPSPVRPFVLPFYIVEGKQKPFKIELKLTLPPHAAVYLSPVKLLDRVPEARIGGRVILGKWRSDRELGRIGGTYGGIIGGLGGLVGITGGIIGVLAGTGKARKFVTGLIKADIALAIAALIAGIVMVLTGQWWVFYVPLFFFGLLLLTIMVPMLSMVRMRYDALELRRIRAQDVGG